MQALVNTEYGGVEVLSFREVGIPEPKEQEVQVRVRATTVNRTDCGVPAADPFIVRLFTGLRRPNITVLGSEFAGVVTKVGGAVTELRPGDDVFGLTGDALGAHADYLVLPESGAVARKPSNLSFEESAGVPDGMMLAYSYIKAMQAALGAIDGTRMLVNGATGSIGTAGVQLAKYFGAKVTAVAKPDGVELARSLGADEVIDHTQEDFTSGDRVFDVVFDAIGKNRFSRCKKVLRPGGLYLSTDLGPFPWNPLLALWTKPFGRKKVLFPLPQPSKQDMHLFRRLLEEGRYTPVIDRIYSFAEIVEAYRYVETGRKNGNVVIRLSEVD